MEQSRRATYDLEDHGRLLALTSEDWGSRLVEGSRRSIKKPFYRIKGPSSSAQYKSPMDTTQFFKLGTSFDHLPETDKDHDLLSACPHTPSASPLEPDIGRPV